MEQFGGGGDVGVVAGFLARQRRRSPIPLWGFTSEKCVTTYAQRTSLSNLRVGL